MTHQTTIEGSSVDEKAGMSRARSGLLADQRGAVMLTGLFMAFSLVGALWFVIGVGEAIIFRDRMQEAADHAVFTSAAIQAKGMNFISAVNIIMLLMVIVHIVLGLIHDVLLAVCLTTAIGCVAYVPARSAYHGYARIMKPILTGLSWGEKVAAWGYPWLGTVKGYQMGSRYGNQGRTQNVSVVVAGGQNIPGFVGTGLPVSPQPFGYLCEKVAYIVFDFGKNIAERMIPRWVRAFIDLPFGPSMGDVWSIFRSLIGGAIRFRYCNDMNPATAMDQLANITTRMRGAQERINRENQDIRGRNRDNRQNPDGTPRTPEPEIENFEINRTSRMTSRGGWSALIDPGFDPGWGNHGPQVPSDSNGGNGHQVWAINFGPQYQETSEKRVTLARGPTGRHGGLTGTEFNQRGIAYYAQAEFYFDCTETWDNAGCNGGATDHNAGFALKWRARLRRVSLPNLGGMLANFGLGQLTSHPAFEEITGALGGDIPLLNDLGRGPLSSIGVGALQTWLGQAVDGAVGGVTGQIVDAAGTPTAIGGAYH